MSCLICERIELIKQNKNSYFVIELETGYVVLGDHQRFFGYTLFLCKKHVSELHHLDYSFKMKYLEEMSLVAQAVQKAFNADKMNYELLGNGESHLHWHLFPRRKNDMPFKGPVWWLPREEMWQDSFIPDEQKLIHMKKLLIKEVNALITK
ncbi:MAG: HIT family protein [Clostridiales bacterium]|nr:MAG: HIT family protein [Clostridiales bacterium]